MAISEGHERTEPPPPAKKPGEHGTDDNPSPEELADRGEAPIPEGEEDREESGDAGDDDAIGANHVAPDDGNAAGADADRDEQRAQDELRKKPPHDEGDLRLPS